MMAQIVGRSVNEHLIGLERGITVAVPGRSDVTFCSALFQTGLRVFRSSFSKNGATRHGGGKARMSMPDGENRYL